MRDRDFLDSVATQARRPRPANDNLPTPAAISASAALVLALLLLAGAAGLIVTFLKIAGLL